VGSSQRSRALGYNTSRHVTCSHRLQRYPSYCVAVRFGAQRVAAVVVPESKALIQHLWIPADGWPFPLLSKCFNVFDLLYVWICADACIIPTCSHFFSFGLGSPKSPVGSGPYLTDIITMGLNLTLPPLGCAPRNQWFSQGCRTAPVRGG